MSSTQSRLTATGQLPWGTNDVAYKQETNLDSWLGDIGLYADLNLRFTRWLSLRGGLRGDLFTYDIDNHCAQPASVDRLAQPGSSTTYDASCLDQYGSPAMHREPDQRVSTANAARICRAPRSSVGPFYGFGLTTSAGKGVRSIDPIYVVQGQGLAVRDR